MSDKNIQGNLNILAHGKIGRLLWNYSIPAVVGMLVMSLYNVVDRIFIGQAVGTMAIAGLTVTFPVMNLSSAIGVLVGAGASARVSIMLGAKNQQGAETTLGNSLTLIVTNALIYITLFWIFLDDILMAFGASESSLPYAHEFMVYILPGMLIMNVGFSLNNVMRASGYPVKAMVSMFLGSGINLVLAPLFIFVFEWGIKGAAIATDISMTAFGMISVLHFMQKKHSLHFTRGCFRLRKEIVIGIIGIGAAPSLVNLASCFINVIINNNLYKYGGDTAVAVAGIFVTFTSLLTMVVVGICQGMQPIVGYNYGAGNMTRLKRTYWLAVGWGTAVVSIGAAIGLLFPQYIARAFAPDITLIDKAQHAFSIAMVCFWVVGFQIVTSTFFQSIGQVGKSIFLSLARQVIFLIPLLLVLSEIYQLDGVWMSFPISDILATLVSAVLIILQLKSINQQIIIEKRIQTG